MSISVEDRELINKMRVAADHLAKLSHECQQRGYVVQFKINGDTGLVDMFEISRLTKIDLRELGS